MSRTAIGSIGALALVILAIAPARAVGQADPRAQLFVARGCTECHTVFGLSLKAKTDAGPDLTYAYGDVTHRYGLTLEQFFERPVGVMRIVFGGRVQLTRAASDSLLRVLRTLYGQGLADRTDEEAPRPTASPSTPFARREP